MSRSTTDLKISVTTTTAENTNGKNAASESTGGGGLLLNRSGSTERLLITTTNANIINNNNISSTTTSKGATTITTMTATGLVPSVESPASACGSTTSDHDQDSLANISTVTAASASAGSGTGTASGNTGNNGTSTTTKVKMRECPVCLARQPSINFPQLSYCHHRSCQTCLVQYLHMEILESRVNVTCPECSEPMHPNDIYKILSVDGPYSPFSAQRVHLIEKYEEFSVRRVLMSDPDTRWCPAPDCSYAVIASGCAACPELRCQRPGCGTLFCYHCKMTWHPNQTCDEARAQRGSFATSPIHIDTTIRPGDIKACPRCRTYIVKMNDGSCNHMICALCGAEFCWLCLREISDLHYLSPSGCTFWGKKPWSRKKKLLWQLGMLVGAPVGIALVAGLAVPAIIFGVPVWVGRKVHQKLKDSTKAKRRVAITASVFGSVLMSPVLASMAVGVGVPILLAYVYGVVPLSLCRNGSCGVTASSSGVRLDLDDDIMAITGASDRDPAGASHEKAQLLKDAEKQDASTVTGFSMQSGSTTHHKLQIQADVCSTGTGVLLGGCGGSGGGGGAGGSASNAKNRRSSMESGATTSLCGDRCFINYEEASTKALAGSTYCDDKSVHTMGSLLESGGVSYFVESDQMSAKGYGYGGGAGAETKSSKSVSSGGVALGHPSAAATNPANADNASTVAMAGSICGVPMDSSTTTTAAMEVPGGGQCSRCGGRRSSVSSALRNPSHGYQHHIHHAHGGGDDHFVVVAADQQDRAEQHRDVVREPRVTRFADEMYLTESADVSLLDRHYGFLPIDEESNSNSNNSPASKSTNNDHHHQRTAPPSLKTTAAPHSNLAHRQAAVAVTTTEKPPSSFRRFLFMRGGTGAGNTTATTSPGDEFGKQHKRSHTSIDNNNGTSDASIDLTSISTSIGCTNATADFASTASAGAAGSSSCGGGEERRCRIHRDECQCDDAEFLLLPPDAYIVHHQQHRLSPNPTLSGSSRRFSASSGSGRMKKSRSWSVLLLEGGGGSGQMMTSSIAAELWSTVRGAFTGAGGGGGGGAADLEAGGGYHHHRYASRSAAKRANNIGLVQRLRSGRRATVSTSAANVATTSSSTKKAGSGGGDKKQTKMDVASSCTSLPETYVGSSSFPSTMLCGGGDVTTTESSSSRQRALSGSSPSKSTGGGGGGKRVSATLASFFKPPNEK